MYVCVVGLRGGFAWGDCVVGWLGRRWNGMGMSTSTELNFDGGYVCLFVCMDGWMDGWVGGCDFSS